MSAVEQPMTYLMGKMVRAKRNPGYVTFVKHSMIPVAQPTRGQAVATREEAEGIAREMLTNPVFTQAWTVGRDGIREVTR